MRQGASATEAARAGVEALERVSGTGGVISVDPSGDVGWAFNTERMTRAWIDALGNEGSGWA
jgi:beta-aspartyl-peptidase (threonine type)